jgi:hypothetical protein
LKKINTEQFRICLVTSRSIHSHFESVNIDTFIPIEDLGINVWYGSVLSFVRDVGVIASLLRIERPDLAFGMMHYPSSLLAYAKKRSGLELGVIASPRGPATEYLRHFEQKLIRKWYLKKIFTFFCRHSDGIVVSSRGMKDECVNEYHAPALTALTLMKSGGRLLKTLT